MQKKCWQTLYQINKLDFNKKEEMLLILSGLEIKFLNKIYKNIQKKKKKLLHIIWMKHFLGWDWSNTHSLNKIALNKQFQIFFFF